MLTSLPLLQGASGSDIIQILDKVAYDISSIDDGEHIIEQGESCQQLVYLIEGTLLAKTTSREYGYTFTENIQAPAVIEPDILYGIQRQYSSQYTTVGQCKVFLIPKRDVNRMFAGIEVFRLNYLNLLSTLSVRRRKQMLSSPTPDLRTRVTFFFKYHAVNPSGQKHFNIRKVDLSNYLGVSRDVLSKVLHEMQDEGLIHIDRNHIDIPKLENL